MEEYDLESTMVNMWLAMVRDFRNALGHEDFASQAENRLRQGIKSFRSYEWPDRMYRDWDRHKAEYQLETFFKRFRFGQDVYSNKDLVEMSLQKFLDTQVRIARPLPLKERSRLVLRQARKHASRILGKYVLEEHISACRFGKKACVGFTKPNSYLDTKLSGPITGSKAHLSFLQSALDRDPILSRMIGGIKREEVETLTLSFVPKSFKALRAIMPDTLAGSFYTSGLGSVIAQRLRSIGLDIRFLQREHGLMIRRSSRTLELATADLSSASDSLTLELLCRLLPRDWFRAVVYGRIGQCTIAGGGVEKIHLSSVLTMGLGQTFPLQTVVFYCLLLAIKDLSGVEGAISVYGDDLIYPSKMHRFVRGTFEDLHLILNEDKTYVRQPFRESCGSDYYCGFDVRPFCFEGGPRNKLHDRLDYVRHLYQLLNGVKRRWSEDSIPLTIGYLRGLVVAVDSEILQIPPDFPDYSGERFRKVREGWPYRAVGRTDNNSPKFEVYMPKRQFRKERPWCDPYYWEKLRTSADPFHTVDEQPLPFVWNDAILELLLRIQYNIPRANLQSYEVAEQQLIWRVIKHRRGKDCQSQEGSKLPRKLRAYLLEKTDRVVLERQTKVAPNWS